MFYPFQLLADWLSFNLLNLATTSRLGLALNFFLYDSLKIISLLILINYLMAIVRYYLPVEKLRDFLTSRKWYGFDHLLAALFGAITPFCSCSSIPLFIGFVKAGIPLGVTLSFLITSPLINEAAVILFIGLFGWKITLIYVLAGLILGVVSGFILGKFHLEKYVEDFIWQIKKTEKNFIVVKQPFKKLLKTFWLEGWTITKKIIPYVLGGLAVGAFIHGYVPTDFFAQYITADNLFAVPISVLVAVPMYASAVSIIPIMQSLVEKGIPLGTALAFMMATVGLSLPEALILKKVMKTKLLIYFFGLVTINIIIIGYIFNLILG
ncbi:MAG: permease [Candidatus Uhrbacteria bacterium]